MLHTHRIVVLLCFGSGLACALPPVIPGLHGKHPLDEPQVGALLIDELRCAACHADMGQSNMKQAPDLSNIGHRLTTDYIKRYIADPATVHPGTTMPQVLGMIQADERTAIAADIAAYLSSQKNKAAPILPDGEIDPHDGKELFHSIGCVACHSPRNEAQQEVLKEGVMPLSHVQGKYLPAALGAFLHAPLDVRPSGRMPDMKLSIMEAHSLAAYLEGANQKPIPATATIATPESIAAGRKAFETYNCTACHLTEKEELKVSLPTKPRNEWNLNNGCLSEKPNAAPHFSLSNAQRAAIRKALEKPTPQSTETKIDAHLTRMNCIACHVRDDFGGVSTQLDSFFHSSEEALGNESRIPPPLTMVGAKLRAEWLKKVLYDGASVRPYMKTRMPQFGSVGLADLADLFAQEDQLKPAIILAPPERENQAQMRDAAHDMLGDQGMNCIACHNYNGKESPGMKGIDLMTSYERLQPTWFYRYMLEPNAFRPGIIMPSYWPKGKSTRDEILDGDAEEQIRALWDNFSLGRSARDPSGLRNEPSKLVVTDQTRTYRGRSSVAGYRGIAVGFPSGINYAFNAEYGSLSAFWLGEYVRVGWQGQGSGNFDPLTKHIALSQDVGFLSGQEAPAVWPKHPVITKEQPVNPDPLYPKKHGYAFLGYSLDVKSDTPTFRYRCGKVLIEDCSTVSEEKILTRNFAFTSDQPVTLWFRALSGKIKTLSSHTYQMDRIKITVPEDSATVRQQVDGSQELLLKISATKGKSQLSLSYEILP
jgi:cbb3-type cytochrome oxidase cytochrome c subunit